MAAAGSVQMCPNPKALFIHNGAIGDFIVASRLMAICNEHFGRHTWTYLGKPALGKLAIALGLITHCEDFSRPGWHLLFSPDTPLPSAMETFLKSFNLIVNLIAGPTSLFSSRLTATATSANPDWNPMLYHVEPKPPTDFADHTIIYQAGQMGFTLSYIPCTPYKVDEVIVREVQSELNSSHIEPNRLVLFHPGASAADKRCPLKHFYELISQTKTSGLVPGILLGEVELEQFSDADISRLKSTAITFSDWPLEKIAGLLSIAHSYVGNDNGISHLAGAVGTPTTVIFLKNNANVWRPIGPNVQIIDLQFHRGICR